MAGRKQWREMKMNHSACVFGATPGRSQFHCELSFLSVQRYLFMAASMRRWRHWSVKRAWLDGRVDVAPKTAFGTSSLMRERRDLICRAGQGSTAPPEGAKLRRTDAIAQMPLKAEAIGCGDEARVAGGYHAAARGCRCLGLTPEASGMD